MRKINAVVFVVAVVLMPFSPAMGAKDKGAQVRQDRREALTIFEEEVQKKRHDFLESLKLKSAKEKREAMEAFRQEEAKEKKEFLVKQHAANMDFLKQKMSGNSKMTEQEKEELIVFFEKQYADSVNFTDYVHRDAVKEFDKMVADLSLTMEQRKIEIRRIAMAEKERIRQQRSAQRRKEDLERQRRNQPTPRPNPVNPGMGRVPSMGE